MSLNLVFDQMEPCVMIDKTTVDDGYGSVKPTYVVGAGFNAFIRLDNSLQAKIAEKDQGISYATIVTPYSIVLSVNDIVKRLSDSKIFRVTSDSDDYKVPASASAGMKLKKVTAEEWELPKSY